MNKLISFLRAVCYTLYELPALNLARIFLRRKETAYPLISVYCPTYNRKEILLDRAVKSVLAQTYECFEFIIVGDCCTDGTEEYLKAHCTDPRVKFVNLKERKKRYPETRDNHWFAGPVVAANAALKLCRGDYIARIDDDDIWTKKHLEALLHRLKSTGSEFVSSAYMETRHGKNKVIQAEGLEAGGTSSWLYKSYLKLFKYNIDCWRKSNNRVNDLDLIERMRRAGVKMAYRWSYTYYITPRPGEDTVGSEVYRNSEGTMDQYKFEEK